MQEALCRMRPAAVMIGIVMLLTGSVAAQQGTVRGLTERYHPLNQHIPPGQAAGWLNYIRRYDQTWLQPVLVEIPGGGTVEVFSGSNLAAGAAASPALVAASAGHLYRLAYQQHA